MLELEKLLPKKVPVRQLRVAELIKKIVAEAIAAKEIDSKILTDNFITVAKVNVSPDLQNASIYITCFQAKDSKQLVVELNKIASKFRFILAKHIKLKTLPHLTFRYDDTLDYIEKIDHLINKN